MNPNDAASIQAMIARKMGTQPPEAAAQQIPAEGIPPQAQAPAPAPQKTPAQEQRENPTESEKALEAATPIDGGDENPIVYSVDMGEGKKRDFTPQQIKGLLDRYQSLNYKHMQTKPILDVIERQMKEYGATPEELVDLISNLKKAKGAKDTKQAVDTAATRQTMSDGDGDDIDSLFSSWENDNAASLPPGYKDMHKSVKGINGQITQLTQMLQKVLGATQGITGAAKATVEDARGQQSQAIRQRIANNLTAVQQKLGLPDDAAKDFMAFSMERGYTIEDFVDPQLTIAVMSDFSNQRASPEMERIRRLHQRREAFTGSLPTGAGAPSAAQAPNPMEADIEAMLTRRRR